MNKNNYCIIMAGGVGSRFWPMSRTAHPKQFLDILGTGETLLQQAFNRMTQSCPVDQIYIVTNEIYRDLVIEQLPDIKEEQIVCEPMRRNTAPCIAYASYKIADKNPDARIVVAPSDHIIMKASVFTEIVNEAMDVCSEKDWLFTLGIKPNRPDTGYGYIQFVENIKEKHPLLHKVKTFTEKPNLELANSFLQSGDFLWNSGIFVWSVKSILNAFNQYLPEMNELFSSIKGKYNTPQEKELISNVYTVCKSISIDYGIMEKANNVHVFATDFGWSDLGTWGSLYEHTTHNSQGNAVVGKKVMMYDSCNCIVNVPNDKLVVIQGLENYIVVESDGILLICNKDEEQQIRQFVSDVMLEKGEKYV